MNIQTERMNLLKSGKTRTQAALELYEKYYSMLYRFAEGLKGSKIKQIQIDEKSVKLISENGIIIDAPEDDIGVISQWLIEPDNESYEQIEMLKILNLLNRENKNFVCFDIGSNVGWYTLNLKKMFPDSEVHAFEPGQKTYNQLKTNLRNNSIDSVIANNFGLAEDVGDRIFYACDNYGVASSLADTIQCLNKTKIICKFDTLDNYCKKNKVTPDFIKCDVEGAEFLVLKGGKDTLANSKPAIMIELLRKWTKCFNYHPNDVINYMNELGYNCFTATNSGLKRFEKVDENTLETNYFFLHRIKHIDLF